MTLAVSADPNKVPIAYDVPNIAKHVDWINVMAYNLRTNRNKRTGCPTLTLGRRPTVVDSINAWLAARMPAKQINLGLASYGMTFELVDFNNHGIGAPAKGPGPHRGKYTNETGVLSYYEIGLESWSSRTSFSESACGTPYASLKNTWVAYEDTESIRHKIQYLVKCKGLNGISMWSLDFDDFKGYGGTHEKYPLLRAAVNEMRKSGYVDCGASNERVGGEEGRLNAAEVNRSDWWIAEEDLQSLVP